ncbi:MAG: MFS transporter [Sporolactobacillus sp.]
MQSPILSHNINKGYLYNFCAYFGITNLWVIYLQHQGLSLIQVGLCESIFHLTSLLSEVPSGILADRYSYRTILIWGRLMAIINAIIMLTADNFWLFALAFVFTAWSYNLQSGTIDAFMYESLARDKKQSCYPRVISVSNSIIEAASTLGVILAGWFVHWHFAITYWIYLICTFVAITVLVAMIDPRTLKKAASVGEKRPFIWPMIKSAVSIFRVQPRLGRLMLFHAAFSAIGTTYYYYFQSLLDTYKFSGPAISALLGLSAVLNIAGVQLTPWMQARWKQGKLILRLSQFLTAALLATLINWMSLLLSLYLLINVLMAIVEPLFSNYYNVLIPSEQRVTLLSVASMLFSLVMVVCFPVTGWLVEFCGFSLTFSGLGVLTLLLIAWSFRK